MSAKKDVYKCDLCKNIITELWNGATEPQCCGQSMQKLEANTVDASKEKHVPVISRQGNLVTVKVGSAAHPMTAEHYILFIEVVAGQAVYRKDLVEGDTVAEASFLIDESQTDLQARAFCNLHGFWAAR